MGALELEHEIIADKTSKKKSGPQNLLTLQLQELGVKTKIITLGEIVINDYELDAETLLKRWQNIFKDSIKENNISSEKLQECANNFSVEAKKMADWIKIQPKPSNYNVTKLSSNYSVTHTINPYTGEFLTIHRSNDSKIVYNVSMWFNRENGHFETNGSLPIE